MQLTQEVSFPRGSKSSTKTDKPRIRIQKPTNLFGLNRKHESKKKKSKRKRAEARKNNLEEDELETVAPIVEPHILTHKTIKTDMIILGNVRSVSVVAAEIELPGRIYGYLTAGAVSDVLTERVKAQLKDGEEKEAEQDLLLSNFFEVGQFVPVKVLQIEPVEKGLKVLLSAKPNVINSDLSHTTLRKDMLIWATVAEKLEHGYRLDVGIENVRTFLENGKVPEGLNYKIGQNIWCIIQNCNVASSATTLKVSALQKTIDSAIENDEDRSLHTVLPGMQFNFDILSIKKNGFVGEFLSEHRTYVHDMYFQKPLQDLKEFKEGQRMKGRVLYIEPITKFVFLTLRGIGIVPKAELKVGQIISAKVLGRTSGGIYLQLNETEKGFVTFKRIINSLGNEPDDIMDLVNKKYPKGKEVKCRILDYNRLDAVYVCTVETSVLNEKFFTIDDLTLGQLVTGNILEINNAGVVVKFGNLQGFIDNFHLSNTQYSEKIKSKFRIQQKIKVRILSILKTNSIRLTAKPALVESELCLSNYDDAEIGKQYPGVVIRRDQSGALISFYGNVKGYVYCTHLLRGESADARQLLFDGQVVNATIIGRNVKGLELSLISVKEEDVEIELEQTVSEKRNRKQKKAKVKEETVKLEEEPLDTPEEVSGTINKVQKKAKLNEKKLNKKRKLNEDESCVKKQKLEKSGEEEDKKTSKKRKLKVQSKNSDEETVVQFSVPSMADFFATEDEIPHKEKSSSDDDETVGVENTKKRKLTAAERAQLARQNEEKIRQIENEFADLNKSPESAEQFERLVLANPNSSKIWTEYAAFHLGMAEVEKARVVIKRALEEIQMDKIQEKLNVWIAYLNLENMFGTNESFEKVFEEAVRYNDPYNIYLEAIKMLANSKKYQEMEDKLKKFRGKFKSMPKTWIEMARIYYDLERFDDARKLKEGALISITDKKQHVDMLVQFAIMEFKYGEQSQGEVLFETILSSYPGRVDVWNSYVDQLVKKSCIDLARRVLERATAQRLSLMKMRSLFKKFRDFEKAHGTEETLQQVKDALSEYVARVKSCVKE